MDGDFGSVSVLVSRRSTPKLIRLSLPCSSVNANAEKLRTSFVAHEGKKNLHLEMDATSRYTVDFGWFARKMSELLHDNVGYLYVRLGVS